MTDELEPRIYSGVPPSPFPPADWHAERAAAKRAELEQAQLAERSPSPS